MNLLTLILISYFPFPIPFTFSPIQISIARFRLIFCIFRQTGDGSRWHRPKNEYIGPMTSQGRGQKAKLVRETKTRMAVINSIEYGSAWRGLQAKCLGRAPVVEECKKIKNKNKGNGQ